MYRLDRTAFSMGNHQEAEEKNRIHWQNEPMKERLQAATYLNSIAYNFDMKNQPRMNKDVFSMRKHEN